jgi:plasmid stabilization system protein ParE
MYRVRISSRAARDADRASAWWRKNRDKAPDAFDDEIDDALQLLRFNPGIGEPLGAANRGLRQLYIGRIGYFIYYRVVDDDLVEVLAIWHASRGSRPRL